MNVTAIARVSPRVREERRLRSLLAYLDLRLEWARKRDLLLPSVEVAVDRMCRLIGAALSLLVEYEVTDNTDFWLRVPARKEVAELCFAGLPEPGVRVYNDYERELVATMKNMGQQQQAAIHVWHLEFEIASRLRDGWYLVFNTLTARDDVYREVFSDLRHFRAYVRKVDRDVRALCYGPLS